MSNHAETNNFFQEFLEDYFAECEEHLSVVRQQLLALEASVEQSEIEIAVVQVLFRSFHTLKGLSGMVGIKQAEELAHQMESYLRSLRDDHLMLSVSGFDALIQGTKLLEQIIMAQHNQQPMPDISPVLTQLQQVIPEPNPVMQPHVITPVSLELQLEQQQQVTLAQEQGQQVWHFVFSSNPELAKRGVNVSLVRTHLEEIGKLIYVSPRLGDKGDIFFDFILATNTSETAFESWHENGLTWEAYVKGQGDKEMGRQGDGETGGQEDGETGGQEDGETGGQGDGETIPELAVSNPELPVVSPTTNTPIVSQPSTVVRVDLPKLDDLMRMVGDLVISRARLDDNIKRLQGVLSPTQMRSLQEINLTLERQLRDLREGVMRVRLVPIGEVFARMQFVVRDLVRESGKQATLEITGQETEIDKLVVERMMDPLLHLVRNAVSHGIETSAVRESLGKPPEAKIWLRAKTSGEMVIIEIEDDGQGVDVDKVIAKGKQQGLIDSHSQEESYDSLTILEILCASGFSTKEQADLTSGRGVGMAIVKNTVQELGGMVDLQTEKGKGTRFTIQLPLTLAIADALIINIGQQTFAIPQSAVREVAEIPVSEITAFENNEIVCYRQQVLPLIRLAQLFNLESPQDQNSDRNLKAVIAGSAINAVALVVDRIIGMREIVVRALTDSLVQVIGIAGATELGDGRVVLILDISALIRNASKLKTHRKRE